MGGKKLAERIKKIKKQNEILIKGITKHQECLKNAVDTLSPLDLLSFKDETDGTKIFAESQKQAVLNAIDGIKKPAQEKLRIVKEALEPLNLSCIKYDTDFECFEKKRSGSTLSLNSLKEEVKDRIQFFEKKDIFEPTQLWIKIETLASSGSKFNWRRPYKYSKNEKGQVMGIKGKKHLVKFDTQKKRAGEENEVVEVSAKYAKLVSFMYNGTPYYGIGEKKKSRRLASTPLERLAELLERAND